MAAPHAREPPPPGTQRSGSSCEAHVMRCRSFPKPLRRRRVRPAPWRPMWLPAGHWHLSYSPGWAAVGMNRRRPSRTAFVVRRGRARGGSTGRGVLLRAGPRLEQHRHDKRPGGRSRGAPCPAKQYADRWVGHLRDEVTHAISFKVEGERPLPTGKPGFPVRAASLNAKRSGPHTLTVYGGMTLRRARCARRRPDRSQVGLRTRQSLRIARWVPVGR